MKLEIDCIEITARIIIRKEYLKKSKTFLESNKFKKDITEKIQAGIETPCEQINIEVKP